MKDLDLTQEEHLNNLPALEHYALAMHILWRMESASTSTSTSKESERES